MRTELWIKEIINRPADLVNRNFNQAGYGWASNNATFNYGACWANGTSVLYGAQDVINDIGTYRVTVTVLRPPNVTTLTGSIRLELGIGAAVTPDLTTPGLYTFDLVVSSMLNGSNGTRRFAFRSSANFNGGVTNLNIEKIDGIWQPLEAGADITIPLTLSIAEIQDITKRNASYSKTIVLPGTPSNNQRFRHVANLGATGTFLFNYPVRAHVVQDSQVVLDGALELLQVNVDQGQFVSYEVLIYSDFSDLVQQVGAKLLKGNVDSGADLDFSEWNHMLTVANVNASFYKANPGSGYTYICVDKNNRSDQANLSAAVNWKTSEMTPCLFIKEIWDKIFAQAGFTYTSTFLTGDLFRRLIYPHTQTGFALTDYEKNARSTHLSAPTNTRTYAGCSYTTSYPPWMATTTENVPFHVVLDGVYNNFDGGTQVYTCQRPGMYSVDLDLKWQLDLTRESGAITDWVYNAGAGHNMVTTLILRRSNGQEIGLKQVNSTGPITPNGYISLSQGMYVIKDYMDQSFTYVGDQYLETGDQIFLRSHLELQYRWSDGSGTYLWTDHYQVGALGPSMALNFRLLASSTNKLNVYSTQDLFWVNLNDILHPQVKQLDFVLSIIKMFNLYVETAGEKNLRIEPRNEYAALAGITKDWTAKLAPGQGVTLAEGSDLMRKYLRFQYAEDVDLYNQTYRDHNHVNYGTWQQAQKYNRDEADQFTFTLIFAPTINAKMTNYMRDGLPEVPKIYSGEYNSDGTFALDTSKQYKPRILYWGGLQLASTAGYAEFRLSNELGTNIYNYSGRYPYAGHLNAPFGTDTFDLNFGACNSYWGWLNGNHVTGNNLYATYYGRMVAELTNPDTKVVTAALYLTPTDIKNFRFYDRVRIDKIHYRVNKITDYVPGELTRVELFKIAESPYYPPARAPRPTIFNPALIFSPRITLPELYIGVIDGMRDTITRANASVNVSLVEPGTFTYGPKTINQKDLMRATTLTTNTVFVDVVDGGDWLDAAVIPVTIPEMNAGLRNPMNVVRTEKNINR